MAKKPAQKKKTTTNRKPPAKKKSTQKKQPEKKRKFSLFRFGRRKGSLEDLKKASKDAGMKGNISAELKQNKKYQLLSAFKKKVDAEIIPSINKQIKKQQQVIESQQERISDLQDEKKALRGSRKELQEQIDNWYPQESFGVESFSNEAKSNLKLLGLKEAEKDIVVTCEPRVQDVMRRNIILMFFSFVLGWICTSFLLNGGYILYGTFILGDIGLWLILSLLTYMISAVIWNLIRRRKVKKVASEIKEKITDKKREKLRNREQELETDFVLKKTDIATLQALRRRERKKVLRERFKEREDTQKAKLKVLKKEAKQLKKDLRTLQNAGDVFNKRISVLEKQDKKIRNRNIIYFVLFGSIILFVIITLFFGIQPL